MDSLKVLLLIAVIVCSALELRAVTALIRLQVRRNVAPAAKLATLKAWSNMARAAAGMLVCVPLSLNASPGHIWAALGLFVALSVISLVLYGRSRKYEGQISTDQADLDKRRSRSTT